MQTRRKRNIDMHTAQEIAELRILRALSAGPQAMPSVLGYAAFPDYRFNRPQGAAFAAAKILNRMCEQKLIQREPRGFSILLAGTDRLAQANNDRQE